MFNLKNIILISKKNEKQYRSRALLRSRCHCWLEFLALVRTPLDASKSAPSFAFNAEKAELALTSRRCCLLTIVLVDPTSRRWDVTTWGRHDVGTSRRGDVTTWGHRDVGTSRRSSHLHTLLSTAPNCFQSLLFSTHLHLHSPN